MYFTVQIQYSNMSRLGDWVAGDTSTATVMLRVQQEVQEVDMVSSEGDKEVSSEEEEEVTSEEDKGVSSIGEETLTVTSTLHTDTTTAKAEAGVTEVTMTDDEDGTEEGRTQVSVGEEYNEHLIFAMLQELSLVLGGVAVVAVLGAGLVGGLLRNRRCRHALVKVRWSSGWMSR